MLSEVLREREQQIAFKKRRAALLQEKDNEYLRFQAMERERGISSDQQLAEQLARAKDQVSKFQLMQYVAELHTNNTHYHLSLSPGWKNMRRRES